MRYVNDSFGDAFSRAFYMGSRQAQDEKERQRQLDQNNAAFEAYRIMQEESNNRSKAPYIQNAFNQMNKMTNMQAGLLSGNPAEQAQAVEGAGQAQQELTMGADLLNQARQKYSTAIIDRLAPLVQSGKLPANMAIQLADKYKENELKEMKRQTKTSIIKRLQQEQDPVKRQSIVSELAMLDDTMADKYITDAMTPPKPVSLAPGAQLVNPTTGKVVADNPYKSKPMSEYEKARVAAGFGRGGAKQTPQEKYWTTYEMHNLPGDLALVEEYQGRIAAGEEIKPYEQTKYNQAAARVNAYWQQSGAYSQEPAPVTQGIGEAKTKEGKVTDNPKSAADVVAYQEARAKIKEKYPDATDAEIDEFLKQQ